MIKYSQTTNLPACIENKFSPAIQYKNITILSKITGNTGLFKISKDIRKQLTECRSLDLYSDFFEYLKKYIEATDNLESAALSAASFSKDGVVRLAIKSSLLGSIERYELSSFSISEVIEPNNFDDRISTAEYSVNTSANILEITNKFKNELDVYKERYNTLFLGNVNYLTVSLFSDLFVTLCNKNSVLNCFKQIEDGSQDPVVDRLILSFVYCKYSVDRNSTAYMKAELVIKRACFRDAFVIN